MESRKPLCSEGSGFSKWQYVSLPTLTSPDYHQAIQITDGAVFICGIAEQFRHQAQDTENTLNVVCEFERTIQRMIGDIIRFAKTQHATLQDDDAIKPRNQVDKVELNQMDASHHFIANVLIVDGMVMIRRIREKARTSHLPIIVVSGSCHDSTGAEAIEMGANDFLAKPAVERLLQARINACL